MKLSVRRLAFSAVSAAAYVSLTMLFSWCSFGPLQLRISEVLCILPFFFPQTAWGLFAGCIISNLLSPSGLLDVIFGSLATLLGALCTVWGRKRFSEKIWLARIFACAMPVLWNSLIIGAMLSYMAAPAAVFWETFILYALDVALGEAIVMFAFGLPLMSWLPKTGIYRELSRLYQP